MSSRQPLSSENDVLPADQEGDQEHVVSEFESTEDEEQERPLTAWQEKEGEAAAQQQGAQESRTLSSEEILLLQLLKRAKRHQDLITEIKKSMKVLTTIERGIGKTTGQSKKLQSAFKDTQKQVTHIHRQIATVERKLERNYQRLANQMKKVHSAVPKRPKARSPRRRKKTKARKR